MASALFQIHNLVIKIIESNITKTVIVNNLINVYLFFNLLLKVTQIYANINHTLNVGDTFLLLDFLRICICGDLGLIINNINSMEIL